MEETKFNELKAILKNMNEKFTKIKGNCKFIKKTLRHVKKNQNHPLIFKELISMAKTVDNIEEHLVELDEVEGKIGGTRFQSLMFCLKVVKMGLKAKKVARTMRKTCRKAKKNDATWKNITRQASDVEVFVVEEMLMNRRLDC